MHVIRLRGPWEQLTPDGPVRFQAPGEVVDPDGPTRCRRFFHRPTGFEQGSLSLVVSPAPAAVETEVILNGQSLAIATTDDIRQPLDNLLDRNELTLISRFSSHAGEITALIGEVWLEIDEPGGGC